MLYNIILYNIILYYIIDLEEVERTHTISKDIDNPNKELLGRIEGTSECNMDEGIGKKLRGKCKAAPICPNRRNPPFKIKAHKVDMTIFDESKY